MSAHREPIEIDPETSIGKRIENAVVSSGEGELRIGSHVYVVHRREEESPVNEPKGNVKQFLAAAKELRESLGDDVDWDQVRRNIEELREYDRNNPRPVPNFD